MKRFVILTLLCASALWMQGCKEGDGERAGRELDKATEKTKEGVKDAADKTGEALKKAGDKVQDAATK